MTMTETELGNGVIVDAGMTEEQLQALAEEQERLELYENGYYGIEVSTKTAIAQDDCYDFIDRFEGRLIHYDEFGDDPTTAGIFKATRVRTVDAEGAGIDPDELWDTEQDLWEYFGQLFDPRTNELRKSIQRDFDMAGEEVLILDEIMIFPKHRGKNLGLGVATKLIDLFGPQWGLVVLTPFPIQFGFIPRGEPDKAAEYGLGAFTDERNAAMSKLRRYWQKMKFKPVSRTSTTFYLGTHLKRPSIRELCKVL